MGVIAGEEVARWETGSVASGFGGADERILVSVRLRPLNEKEIFNKEPCDWDCINDTTVIFKNHLPERSAAPAAYTFDKVFSFECTTRQVYEEAAKEVVLSVVNGINSSIFAYGQTSSGKTYTMSGITEYSVADIYDYVKKHEEREFVLKFSAMEIYNEVVRDLLVTDSTPLRLLDDPDRGTIVEKLTEETLSDSNHLRELLALCEAQRQIGETSLNETSSRSHQILRLTIESTAREYRGKESSSTLVASVNFVDLAGSERASQAMSAGARLKEGCHINRSLLTLGTVIRKLSKGRNGHIPYRDSKLTRILQSSLGGNARTAIICTMSPARSHVEQSRNTLLFASCAKEVATNAQVNVIMSDKALVKHLQKELARLESELRNPGLVMAHSENLIREKDFQIRKMDREIKELMQQRDLAQSRLHDLLHSVKEDQTRRNLDVDQSSSLHPSNASNDEDVLSEASSISFQPPICSDRQIKTSKYYADNISIGSAHYSTYHEKQNFQDNMQPQLSISSPTFINFLQHDGEDITSDNPEEFEDLCKEVRCIEMDETSLSKTGHLTEASSSLPPCVNANYYGDQKPISNTKEDVNSSNHEDDEERACMSQQQPENVIRTEEFPSKVFCAEPSPWFSMATNFPRSRSSVLHVNSSNHEDAEERAYISQQQPKHVIRTKEFPSKMFCAEPSPWFSMATTFPRSRSSMLPRSRSCNATITHNSPVSPWFFSEPQNNKTPTSIMLKDFPGRPEFVHRRTLTLKYTTEKDTTLVEGSHDSALSQSSDMLTVHKTKTNSTEDIGRICDFVAGLKEMAQIQYQQIQAHDQTAEEKSNEGSAIKKSMKDVGVGPMFHSSRWMFEFEKQQQEIIDLWHECNVSLIHRTSFFLLFRGEPADSIYMEVELRRLSFLKITFSKGDDSHGPKIGDAITTTVASSLKALRRERDMLSRRMNRKLSSEERKSLYDKWGIVVNSKNRRVQLSRLIWTKTDDMDHIKESASVVAKLIGLLEPGLALKEMFGLSFTLQPASKNKSSSWRFGSIHHHM